MIKKKIGKGSRKAREWECSFGELQADLDKKSLSLTIDNLMVALAKQCEIENGEITFHHIAFSYCREAKKEVVEGKEKEE